VNPKPSFQTHPVIRMFGAVRVMMWFHCGIPDKRRKEMLEPVLDHGVPVKEEKSPQEVRAFVLSQLEQLPLEVKKIKSPSKWK